MRLKQKEILTKRLSYFEENGPKMSDYPLLRATYFDENETAKSVLKNDPSQIKSCDPYAGLTPLHIAIFRVNHELVELYLSTEGVDLHAADRFGRKPVDMLNYTSDQELFRMVMAAVYPDSMQELDDMALEVEENNATVVPYDFKGPK